MDFDKTFQALTGHPPFPWQAALYQRFLSGDIPEICSLPTGMGKTSIIAVWLVALAVAPDKVPRRLVYVVNRRTVVDQTTVEVEKYRENVQAAGLHAQLGSLCAIPLKDSDYPLAISTLRGQFADNREWSIDPARPAVICGTVDMIGSRLLFSGYGCGSRTKPAHAGFLGKDVLLVHDEAHLEPAFQKLIEKIRKEQESGERSSELPWGKLQVMELTATPRSELLENQEPPFKLQPADEAHPVVKQRILATKLLKLTELNDPKNAGIELAEKAWGFRDSGKAILVFANTVDDVVKARDHLIKKGVSSEALETLTGTMRGLERDRLIEKTVFRRFLQEAKADGGTVFLICTSAGEVGVNISASHGVFDLSPFDSFSQRCGRINRFGDCPDSTITVLYPRTIDAEKPLELAKSRTLALLCRLNGNASPSALGAIDQNERVAAFSPPPTILPATDILFDSWALTTIREKLPGRPPVEPYLHGLSSWEPPETQVAWRTEVEVITGDLLLDHKPKDLLEQFPVLPHELLKDRSQRVFDQFFKSKKLKLDGTREALPVWIVSSDGIVEHDWTVRKLIEADKSAIEGKLVLLPPSLGGLNSNGMLDPEAEPRKHGDTLTHEEDVSDSLGQRIRVFDDDSDFGKKTKGMHLIYEINTTPVDEEEGEESPVKHYWMWYNAAQEGERTTAEKKPVLWTVHVADVVEKASQIVSKLPLTEELRAAVILAAKFHDHGKRRQVFQVVLSNTRYPEIVLAKSGGKRSLIKEEYRHEFGSLVDVLRPSDADRNEFASELAQFASFTPEMQDVVLHLIATHHGWGRPHFDSEHGGFEPERGNADAIIAEIPRRFARLQRQYGRWGLAYLESLLRAADWAASANPSEYVEINR